MQREELEKKVRHIRIHSRKPVVSMLAGEYRSRFKGAGIEFEDVREYQHGDDVRTIAWNVSARTGRTHVKLFSEERELTLYFLIDVSGSGDFGTAEMSKQELAARVFALLAFAASSNNDNVGLVLFSEHVEQYVKPRKGARHVIHMIEQILACIPESAGTDIAEALRFLSRTHAGRAVVFLFSDFIDRDYKDALREVARQHDLVCVALIDEREQSLPDRGLLELVDAETGRTRVVDCASQQLRTQLRAAAESRRRQLLETCLEIDADLLWLSTGEDYLHKLIAFFRERKDRSADAH